MSLAMLKVNYDQQQRDYLDYFVPFCHFIVSRIDGKPVSDSDVKMMLESEFGLRIPSHVVRNLLARLAKQGALRKDQGVFYVEKKVDVRRFEALRRTAKDTHGELIAALIRFANEQYSISWTEAEAESALLAFLSRFSLESLRTWRQQTTLPSIDAPPNHAAYLVHAFAAQSHETNRTAFDKLMTVVQGHMLANALLCPDLTKTVQKFRDVTFYLDTPIVLRLLGLEGKARETAASELVEMVRSLGATVAVFDHSDEEVRGVIEGCIRRFSSPEARNAIIREARLSGRTPSDLLLVMETRRSTYDRHRIQVYEAPPYEVFHQIDEMALRGAIQEEIRYYHERALDYDINSIRSIYARRKGVRPRDLDSAIAVFVSSNRSLVMTANSFGRVEEDHSEVGPAISDYALTNVAWLKAPMERPAVPEHEILASCYAFLEPTNNLWDQYLDEVERLRTAGQLSVQHHYLLRNSTVAKKALVQATLGDEEAFEADTVHRVLERVIASVTSEIAESHKIAILEKEREREIVEQQSQLRISELVATTEGLEKIASEIERENEWKDEQLRPCAARWRKSRSK
jgi:hypothetical protein